MDAGKLPVRADALVSSTLSQSTRTLENNESPVETRPDGDRDDGLNVSTETVTFSDTSLKLSSSSPVQSTDKTPTIENNDQARQALNQLIADFQSNPAQAKGAHSNIFDGAVKSLLG